MFINIIAIYNPESVTLQVIYWNNVKWYYYYWISYYIRILLFGSISNMNIFNQFGNCPIEAKSAIIYCYIIIERCLSHEGVLIFYYKYCIGIIFFDMNFAWNLLSGLTVNGY